MLNNQTSSGLGVGQMGKHVGSVLNFAKERHYGYMERRANTTKHYQNTIDGSFTASSLRGEYF